MRTTARRKSSSPAAGAEGPTDDGHDEARADYTPSGDRFAARGSRRPPGDEEPADDEFSPFAERDLFEGRGRSPILTVAIIVIVIAAIAAAFWFLAPPEWKARVGITEAARPRSS